MTICTLLPSDLLHLISAINVYEGIRRGLVSPDSKPCSTVQKLFPQIEEVIVESSLVGRTGGNRGGFWTARSKALSLDDWIALVAAMRTSMDLTLFHTDESEMPRWVQISFANMGNYGLAVTIPGGTVAIEAVWRPNKPKKVWDVEFREARHTPHTESKSLNESYATFLQALRDISDFAKRSERYTFVPIFESAMDILESGGEMTRYAGCLLDETIFTPGARQLFEAVGRCWVFGGMGSWDDIIIRDQNTKREHEAITSHFFDALMQAILSVANKGRNEVAT
jgi:hypothetical protein